MIGKNFQVNDCKLEAQRKLGERSTTLTADLRASFVVAGTRLLFGVVPQGYVTGN